MNILTLNAGSSSIKYKVFLFTNNNENTVLLSGLIEGIGESGGVWSHQYQSKEKHEHQFSNHKEAFDALDLQLKQDLINYPIHGVGHRVVHGGNKYFEPTVITPLVLADIHKLAQLAPLHNPVNALGIEYAVQHFQKACQVAIFDTGFHHSMPSYVSQYAIDTEVALHYQVQRYGFHGINHEYVAISAAKFLNKPLSSCNFISLHLGNGASACLIKEGKSFDTSMGMTPLAGLMMGTRCGDIDPAIPLYLLKQGVNANDIDTLLNKKSGLKGIAAENDMRKILTRVAANDEKAQLAVEMYVYALQKIIGAYLSQCNTFDALIFTGGIGENAALIREKTLSSLKHLGFNIDDSLNYQNNSEKCKAISVLGKLILVICGDEESLMAQKVAEQIISNSSVNKQY